MKQDPELACGEIYINVTGIMPRAALRSSLAAALHKVSQRQGSPKVHTLSNKTAVAQSLHLISPR